MRTKKVYGIVCLFSLISTYALAIDNKPSTPDKWKVGNTQASTTAVRMDYHGNILPTVNAKQSLGTSSETWSTVNTANVYTSSGLISITEEWEGIPGPSTSAISGTFFALSTATLRDNGTSYSGRDITQSTVSRNLTAIVLFDEGTSTSILTCNANIIGWDAKGLRASETISFSTATLSANIGTGNIAWSFINSISVQITSASQFLAGNLRLDVGTTNQIGLQGSIESSSDVVKVVEGSIITNPNTVNVDNRVPVINATYSTVRFGSAPGVAGAATQEKRIHYRAKRSNR